MDNIIGKPSNASFQVLKCQINNNAASIPSRQGDGTHGHLGIVLDTIQYLVVSSNMPWFTPKYPGGRPNLAPATTAVQSEQITCQHDTDLEAFGLCNRSSNALKQQLTLSVNGRFLCALEDPTFGFMTTTMLAMLQHFDSTYGTLTPRKVEANHLELSKPCNPKSPIEELGAIVDNILYAYYVVDILTSWR
jgi:hypothetical protein